MFTWVRLTYAQHVLTKPKLRFCLPIFCQTCVRHMNKVSPKEIRLVNAYNHCLQKILEVKDVDLENMPSRQ